MSAMFHTLLIVITTLCFTSPAADITLKKYTKEEFADQLKTQSSIIVKHSSRYEFEIVPEWINWVRRKYDYGYPIALYNGILKKKDASCLIIFGPKPELIRNRATIRADLFDVLGMEYEYPKRVTADSTMYVAKPVIPDTFHVSDYVSTIPGKRTNIEKIVYYRVPDSSSASFMVGDDDTPSFVQRLHESEYPVIYRVFFMKDGNQVFDLIMLLSEEASKHPQKYIKELRQLFYYDYISKMH